MMFTNGPILAVGEAMVEMAPVEGGLYRRGYAGDTFNTLWHLAQLSGRAAGFVTRVGTDAVSDAFVASLAADGLDVATIGRDPARSMGLYMIELDGAERSFLYWREASAARQLADDADWLRAQVRGAALIHLSGITLAILPEAGRATLMTVLDEARQAGARVAFDPNLRPKLWPSPEVARTAMAALLPLTDIVLPSFDDEAALWGDGSPAETRARLAAAGVDEIIIKDGPNEVHWQARGESGSCAPPAVADIRDTTGAGDSFNAGYLAARLAGLPPATAVARGQALAADVIRHFGARLPRDQLHRLRASWRGNAG